MNKYEPTDNELERRSLYYGRIGPAYDDVWPVFLIDGRDYSNAAAVRAEVVDARNVLRRHHIIFEMERKLVKPSTWRLDLPTWREYRAQHFPDEPPTPMATESA